MKTFPMTALTWMFTRLPSPAVAIAAAALAVFFVSDVAIPDFLPFLDEAVLAFLFTGAMTELIQRRKARGRDSAVLVEEDRVAVGVGDYERSGA
jgi:hypothetical protein